jgi:hypothetical protein
MGQGHGCSAFQTGGATGGDNDWKYTAPCVFLSDDRFMSTAWGASGGPATLLDAT